MLKKFADAQVMCKILLGQAARQVAGFCCRDNRVMAAMQQEDRRRTLGKFSRHAIPGPGAVKYIEDFL